MIISSNTADVCHYSNDGLSHSHGCLVCREQLYRIKTLRSLVVYVSMWWCTDSLSLLFSNKIVCN